MKILFLSRWYPFPPDNGAKIRVFQLLKALSEKHTVDLLSFSAEKPETEAVSAQPGLCRRVETVQYRPFQPERAKAILGFLSSQPRFLVDTYQPEMAARITWYVEHESYDVVIASQIDMAAYAGLLPGMTKIFEEIETGVYLDGLEVSFLSLAGLRRRATWWKHAGYLKRLLHSFDGWTVVSENERRSLERIDPGLGRARVIPNGVDLERSPAHPANPRRGDLVYAGSMTYRANFDAVQYFLRQIFPLILKKHPEARLFVTGSLKNVDVGALDLSPNVVLTGVLPDIATQVADCWASVVPLRIGGGTRLKILESMALGTPVVSTSKGIEGLDVTPGRHALVADAPEAFAAQVVSLLDNPSLRDRLGMEARQLVQREYDWRKLGAAFREYIEETALRQATSIQAASGFSENLTHVRHT